MKIVILAGGTGSIALQTGLDALYTGRNGKPLDGIDVKVIVNAYDNGLSTGAVRQVMGGRILGPSDVRKNQTTRLKLEQPKSPWNEFLDIRFTEESSQVKSFCLSKVDKLEKDLQTYAQLNPVLNKKVTRCQLVREAIEEYFKSPIATKIDYNDFSLANIIYAGFAKANGYSLRKAASIMASLMGIADNVLINDDESLFLGAITKSRRQIADEGDIVSWGNLDDPFVDVFFTNVDGEPRRPILNDECKKALLDADLIILSSGTQWSSLIPTYASYGFKEVIEHSTAKIVMVMNRQPDKDSPGQTASDILDLLVPEYFPEGRINVVLDSTGSPQMNTLTKDATALINKAYLYSLGVNNTRQKASVERLHDPKLLATAVMAAYFGDSLTAAHFMFDYDDTLVGRGNTLPKSSAFNRKAIVALNEMTSVSICTGNTIKAVRLQVPDCLEKSQLNTVTVYADGGVNKYELSLDTSIDSDDGVHNEPVQCVYPAALIDTVGAMSADRIIALLQQSGIPRSKIENRGGAMITIKPIDEEYRPLTLKLVELMLNGSKLVIRSAGRTTIEIVKPELNKSHAVQFEIHENRRHSIAYVGDELVPGGNDYPVLAQKEAHCITPIAVKNPAKTAVFLITLLEILKPDASTLN